MGCFCSREDILLRCTYQNTMPYKATFSRCRSVKVYDGDTLHVAAIPDGHKLPYRFNIRMLGYDSPELRSKNEREIKAAELARDTLESLVNNKVLRAELAKESDKYGRYLAVLYDEDGLNINEEMIRLGHGKRYNGGKKEAFDG